MHAPFRTQERKLPDLPTLSDDSDRRIAALTTLLDVALALANEQNEDRILEIVTRGATQAAPCERASLFLLDERRRELYTRTVTQLELNEIRIPWERGIIGWVAREGAVASVADPQRDPRWDSSFDRQTGFVTRNVLAAPVASPTDGRLIGVLQLLNTRRPRFDGFDEQIAQAFAAHAASALERTRLQAEANRAAELRREMELARRIQRGFLPEQLPAVEGYDIASWWQPAEFVSGDYYDWFRLPDERIGLAVGDVCGHGVGPSLIMASLRAMLHVLSKRQAEPDEMMSLLAQTLSCDLKETQFVTFLLAALDPREHTVRFCNAGHGPALHVARRAGRAERLKPTQLPLGFPTLAVNDGAAPIPLEPGDLLVLGTDGIIEARNRRGELFGFERLIEAVLEDPGSSAADVARRISEAVTRFQDGQPAKDDATLLVVERKELR
jgi:serine phosphatase RsbU (regulator of sigma subunit)